MAKIGVGRGIGSSTSVFKTIMKQGDEDDTGIPTPLDFYREITEPPQKNGKTHHRGVGDQIFTSLLIRKIVLMDH